MFTCFVNVEII